MNVFVTGPSGWIGSAVVDQLLATGHQVTGLARSDASAAVLEAKGATVHRGELDDPDTLRSGAQAADAVVHLAFKHDFADMAAAGIAERNAVQALCETLEGSGRPLLLASGLAFLAPGHAVTEDHSSPAHGVESLRGGAENLALDWAKRRVGTIICRFPPSVHGASDPGFIAALVHTARERGESGYIDDGANRWSAIHRGDAAQLVQLALDTPPPAGRGCPLGRSPKPSAPAWTCPSPPYPPPRRRSTSGGWPCSSVSTSPPAARPPGPCSAGPPPARL